MSGVWRAMPLRRVLGGAAAASAAWSVLYTAWLITRWGDQRAENIAIAAVAFACASGVRSWWAALAVPIALALAGPLAILLARAAACTDCSFSVLSIFSLLTVFPLAVRDVGPHFAIPALWGAGAGTLAAALAGRLWARVHR